ncbi:ABC transporter permease [Lutispora sp.]|uniref:ABC transporter permease n=1 Tax=Lutispora sp. TaxID=2828727 RepID=UPI000EE43F8B|nr:ABC transporter permease [Lutispora sp.]MEA4963061.1 ABC transporter permease [Lutispora sp.]HCJ55985.1 peptide ABC transporter permease [Clostridiaceae bacterium]
MYRYIIKRLLLLIPIILGVIVIVFTIMYLTPGDPGRNALGMTATQAQVDEFNHKLGYDRPYLVRLGDYIVKGTQGDFGISYKTGKPVFGQIYERLPVTVTLAVFAVLMSLVIGLPIGILSAVKQYSAVDMISTVTAMLLAAIPEFWLGLMLMLFFGIQLKILPIFGADTAANYVLPVITLALPTSAVILRLTRATMLEAIRQDYIRTARAKGAKERTVIFRHALRNALLPVITVVGNYFGGLLGGTIMIEIIYNMPGLGMLMYNSIKAKDVPQVMATVIFLSILFCIIMLLVDIIQSFVDPRIRSRYANR